MALEIRLFRSWEALRDGKPLPRTRTQKERLLLALLVLRCDRETDRHWLAGTLWPDSTEEMALHYLRRSLSELRRVLSSDAWRIRATSSRTVRLDTEHAEVDVIRFDSLIAAGGFEALVEAIELYRGPLLEAWDEEILETERMGRAHAYRNALARMAERSLEIRDFDRAVEYARRLLAAEAGSESAVRTLMEAFEARGERQAALQEYRDYRRYLHENYGDQPTESLAQLYRRLRQRGADADKTASPAGGPSNLPHFLTALLGRDREIGEGLELLTRSRLVTLTGVGGVGKTRLAIEIARRAEDEFVDGAWFVDLAPVSGTGSIATAIVGSLRFNLPSQLPILDALATAIQARRMLLVMDNCEHLLPECASTVQDLLSRCSDLTVLATSREPLGIPGERRFRVHPLAVPAEQDGHEDPRSLLSSDSIRLFVERVQWADGDFDVTEANARDIVRTCRALDGIPLALELAAAQTASLGLQEALSLLPVRERASGAINAAGCRHRTMHSALDWSWSLLSDTERSLLMHLSVLRGYWDLQAADALANFDSRGEVASLVEKSWLEWNTACGERRYRLLEPVRQYAVSHLGRENLASVAERRRAEYYLSAVEAAGRCTGRDWLTRTKADSANITAALEWALEEGSLLARAVAAAPSLTEYWTSQGYVPQAVDWWRQALDAARDLPPTLRSSGARSLARLLFVRGDTSESLSWAERAAALAREAELDRELGEALRLVAFILVRLHQFDRAKECFAAAVEASQRAGDDTNLAWTMRDRVELTEEYCGDVELARKYASESLRLFRRLVDPPGVAHALNTVAAILIRNRIDLKSVRQLLEESLSLHRELDDRIGMSISLALLSELAVCEGDRAEVWRTLQESMVLRQRAGDAMGIAACYRSMGHRSEEEGKLDAARAYFEKTLELRRKMGTGDGCAAILLRIGEINRAQNRLADAREKLNEALEVAQRVGHEDLAVKASSLLTALAA